MRRCAGATYMAELPREPRAVNRSDEPKSNARPLTKESRLSRAKAKSIVKLLEVRMRRPRLRC